MAQLENDPTSPSHSLRPCDVMGKRFDDNDQNDSPNSAGGDAARRTNFAAQNGLQGNPRYKHRNHAWLLSSGLIRLQSDEY